MSYSVGIIGATGAVGREMLNQLELRGFPVSELRLFATPRSHGQELYFKGDKISIRGIEVGLDSDAENVFAEQFAGLDVVLLSAGGGVSKIVSPCAAAAGAVAVDNSSAFRMERDVPLVVPEVNPEALEGHKGIVANPNCSTIQMVVALKPIMDAAGLRRVVVATYQSASGTGKKGADELEGAARHRLTSCAAPQPPVAKGPGTPSRPDSGRRPSAEPKTQDGRDTTFEAVTQGDSGSSAFERGFGRADSFEPRVFPKDIGFNLFPLIDRMEDGCHCREEIKMVQESRKILNAPDLALSVTTVRVPVFVGHSLAIWIETEQSLGRRECLEVLRSAPGLNVFDEMQGEPTPTPLDVEDDDRVWIGRVREDPSGERCLMLWAVANNIRKGAATNTVQIAEELASRGLLGKRPEHR